jgi:outer membrane lipoprotein-sorting protein
MSLLLAIACLVQDSPEEIFKKLEATYADAKNFAMAVAVTAESKRGEASSTNKLEGEYLLKEGRKLRLGLWGKLDGEDSIINLASNGKFMAVAITGMAQVQQKPTPDNLNTDMAAAVVRTGLFGAIYLSMGITKGSGRDGKPADLRVMFPASNFKSGDADKVEVRTGTRLDKKKTIECKTLTFQIEIEEQKRTMDVKVWYDFERMVVIKRMLTTEMKDDKGKVVKNIVTELYENAELMQKEIPDTEFKLPGEK